jgi:hypothetical protein
MNWERLNRKECFKDPVGHIHSNQVFNTAEYDKLYENQNTLDHQIWLDFHKQYKTDFCFLEDINDIDLNKPVICLWFFKERNDLKPGPNINIAGKMIQYAPNTFLVTESKDISIVENKKKYLRRPVLQLDLKLKDYKNILKRFYKIA